MRRAVHALGGYNSIWNPYTTQVDVYLDDDYARANPDSINGNFCLTTNSSDLTCKGTRFDYSSAINDSSGNFLQDYAFDGGTGNPSLPSPCGANGGWVVVASTNLDRSGTNIYDPANDPFCIANSGWYTFKHTFKDVGGSLQVLMEIFPLGSGVPLHSWTITPGHLITDVGCNRYGWFANQEIWDLAIDNSIMVGCGTPLPTTTTTTTTTTTSSTTTTTLPDHFQCYEIKPKAFATVTGVSVQDQFGMHTETVRFAHRLCAPANKNGEDPSAPNHPDHLQGHIVSGPNVKVANLTVANQFGTIKLDIVKPDILMVPTLKSLDPLALPPALTNPTVDHFQCYKAKRSQGSPKFQKILGVKVQDQFGTAMLDLLKPIRLCAPANKRDEGSVRAAAPVPPALLQDEELGLRDGADLHQRPVRPGPAAADPPPRAVRAVDQEWTLPDDHHLDAADDHHLVDRSCDHDHHQHHHEHHGLRDAERSIPGRASRPARLISVTIRSADRRRALLSAGRSSRRQGAAATAASVVS